MSTFRRYGYIAVPVLIFVLDRISKYFVRSACHTEHRITDFLSLEMTTNRGISWGILNSENQFVFVLLTSMIIVVTAILIVYAYRRAKKHYLIYGELFVIAGSLSNIVDRFAYGHVIDFILCRWRDFLFPAFNIADAAIVIGIGIMFLQLAHEP